MASPVLSIIIPTYNRIKTLPQAIDSVLAQTFTDFELLICDDGSTDDTAELVAGIDDPRVRWLPGTRGGNPAIPRNRGLRESRGMWVALLDSDDEWMPDKLQKQLAVLTSSGLWAVSSNAFAYSVPGKTPELMSQWSKNYFSFCDMMRRNLVVTSTVMFNRSLLDKIGGFSEGNELKVGEDYALWLRIASFTDFAYIEEPLVNYLDMPSQSVRGQVRHQTFAALQNVVLRDYLKWCESFVYMGPLIGIAERKICYNYCFGWLHELIDMVRKRLKIIRRYICRKS